jgi:PII-like signaling protein
MGRRVGRGGYAVAAFSRDDLAMHRTDRALRLTIFVDVDDIWQHKPLYHEIVHRAHRFGLAGATVLRGIEGFGAGSAIHTSRLLSLAEDLPAVIVIVDDEPKVREFLPELDGLVSDGLVLLDDVEVVRYG